VQHHGLWINNESRPALNGLTHALQSPATRQDLGHSVSVAEGLYIKCIFLVSVPKYFFIIHFAVLLLVLLPCLTFCSFLPSLSPSATAQDIDLAVVAAEASFLSGVWSRHTDARGRSQVLLRMAQGLQKRLPELARLESLQTGRPLREMEAQLARLPEWFEYFAALIRTEEGSLPPFPGSYINYVQRIPLGVCALLTPWNHPLLIAVKKLAPALAGGNSVVLKPPDLAPLAVLALGEIAKEAGLPSGVLNITPGQGKVAGRALAAHPRVRKVDLTGGTVTGRMTACVAGKNLASVVAELGGKAPLIVFEDVNVEEAVDMCAFAAFVAAGQTCVSGSRLLVHESIFREVSERFVAKAQGLKLGDPLEPSTDMGPLISQMQWERVHGFVTRAQEEGAEVLCGGGKPSSTLTRGGPPLPSQLAEGFFYSPTVVGNVRPEMEIMQEEVFGPVVCLMPFKDEAHALELANNSVYGLGASIHTKCSKRGHRVASQIQAGIVWINDHHRNSPSSPWGGVTAASGLGRENGREGLREYTQEKSVVVGYGEERFDWFSKKKGTRYG